MPDSAVPITWSDPTLESSARAIAQRFGLSVVTPDVTPDPHLILTPTGLSLQSGKLTTGIDFLTGTLAHRIATGSHNAFRGEALVKALTPKHATPLAEVIDATAGLGRDAMLLALAGFHVTAIERHPAVAALLDEGVSRALADELFAARLAGRLTLRFGDAVDLLSRLPPAGVIYLDPMFPQRTKAALVKKQMRLLQQLHTDADSEDDQRLLDAALSHATQRVVVKRPRRAAPLAGREPTFTRIDKTIRYDIYAI